MVFTRINRRNRYSDSCRYTRIKNCIIGISTNELNIHRRESFMSILLAVSTAKAIELFTSGMMFGITTYVTLKNK